MIQDTNGYLILQIVIVFT